MRKNLQDARKAAGLTQQAMKVEISLPVSNYDEMKESLKRVTEIMKECNPDADCTLRIQMLVS